MAQEPSSFRDPSACVYRFDDRIFRVVKPAGQAAYAAIKDSHFFREAQASGRIVKSTEVSRTEVPSAMDDDIVLEHPLLEVVSYPYEWPFALLKAAALHHLDLQLDALKAEIVFSDASAYNIQFELGAPVFIDATSMRPYQPGEPWIAHNQFCVSFLAPLLLQSKMGIPYQAWYRGELEGIPIPDIAKILDWKKYFSPTILGHVVLPTVLSQKKQSELEKIAKKNFSNGMKISRYSAILQQLREYIAELKLTGVEGSTWSKYSTNNTYLASETAAKIEAVEIYAQKNRPDLLIDIGCNDGHFSEAALRGGAKTVVGLDMDHAALNGACERTRQQKLSLLPLYINLANPSPNQGFAEVERASLSSRLRKSDAVIALAVIHHLVIGCNIPLDNAVDWIVGWGRTGIIEFVPKTDSTIQQMLALREDIFGTYTRENFIIALEKRAEIVVNKKVSASGREIFEYKCHNK